MMRILGSLIGVVLFIVVLKSNLLTAHPVNNTASPIKENNTMENVIHEFKIIETEDGFRIEITGDKDAIRQMLHGFGPQSQSFFGNFGPCSRGSGFWSRVRPNFGDWHDRWTWCDQWFSPEGEKEEKSHN
jgi:hypothetical protein